MKIKAMNLGTLILMLFIFAACDNDNEEPNSVEIPSTIEIPKNESVAIAGTDMVISYPTLEEDSRCPFLALCIWEGRAWVSLENTEDGETEEFDLITESSANLDSFVTVQVSDFEFTLLDVFPDPTVAVSRTDSVVVIQIDPI